MARTSLPSASPASQDAVQSVAALSTTVLENLLQAQHSQLETAMAWQRSIFASCQELWDEWTCRFAGGARLDD